MFRLWKGRKDAENKTNNLNEKNTHEIKSQIENDGTNGTDLDKPGSHLIDLRHIFKIYYLGGEEVRANDDVSVAIDKGEFVAIVGKSGSGKSTLGRVICGLLKPDSGELKIHGTSVYASRSGRKNLQKRLSVVFQDYTTSANPRFRVKEIIAEGLAARERNQKIRLNQAEETSRLLELVGLNASYADRYPHELSGGQLQRVCIARAVACQPEIILFDEAISSLDAHTQVQIMDLLRELKEKLGLTYIFITHDLTSVTYICDDVLFLYHGRITEHIPVSHIAETKDEYAKKLLASIIEFD